MPMIMMCIWWWMMKHDTAQHPVDKTLWSLCKGSFTYIHANIHETFWNKVFCQPWLLWKLSDVDCKEDTVAGKLPQVTTLRHKHARWHTYNTHACINIYSDVRHNYEVLCTRGKVMVFDHPSQLSGFRFAAGDVNAGACAWRPPPMLWSRSIQWNILLPPPLLLTTAPLYCYNILVLLFVYFLFW